MNIFLIESTCAWLESLGSTSKSLALAFNYLSLIHIKNIHFFLQYLYFTVLPYQCQQTFELNILMLLFPITSFCCALPHEEHHTHVLSVRPPGHDWSCTGPASHTVHRHRCIPDMCQTIKQLSDQKSGHSIGALVNPYLKSFLNLYTNLHGKKQVHLNLQMKITFM